MRTAHWKARLLLLLLLSLHSISMCFANSCIFDTTMAGIETLVIPKAAQQSTGKDWEPLRIVASIKDLEGPSKYCVKMDGSIGERSTKKSDLNCKDYFDTLTPEQNKVVTGILKRAIALHTDRLLVQRAVDPLKIPDFSGVQFCKFFNVPAEHHTDGVANADMVLYVGSPHESDDDVSTLSLGLVCAKSADGRPIAGALTFGNGNVEITRHTVRFAANQIAHALGFSYGEMRAHNMIAEMTMRNKPNPVAVVKSDKTKKMAQEHYGCPTAEGMELEDGEDNVETLSHWERRNAKDELMADPIGAIGTSLMGFYTSLTMAAFEGMGYYKANFQMAEHMEYGHKAGCNFLNGKCIEKGKSKWPNMFCNVLITDKRANVCTTDRLGMGSCVLKNDYSIPLPSQFQYFESAKEGGLSLSLTDYCPVVEQLPSWGCKSYINIVDMPWSVLSENSMCLDGDALKVKMNDETVSAGAVCVEILCEGGSVKVKYHGDKSKWHDCPEGQSLTPSSTSDSFVSGTINCPKYKEVCTVAPDGSSLVPKVIIEPPTNTPQDPKASQKPTGQPNDPNSGGKSKDSSSVPFGFIPSVAFLVLSFADYLIA